MAAYLLGFDESREENEAKLETISEKANFADGDDEKRAEKAGPIDLRFDVPPSEAIDYFKRKKIIPKKEFEKLSGEAKSAAFTVSGIYKDDILRAFKDEIQTALETGATQKTIVKNFKNILAGAGHKELGDFHLETVARTNMMISYGVGRRRQMESVSDLLPFWEYSAVNDDRTRPTHRALDGVILPADSPFWDTHFPPWNFNCRCTIIARLDMPDGYDLTKPNADTTIALDKNGIPAKAEYGASVHDLSAGKFVGIPKQRAALQETIESATKDSQMMKIKSLEDRKILNQTNDIEFKARNEQLTILKSGTLVEKIEDLQKQMRGFQREHAFVFDRQGELVFYKIGSPTSVDIVLSKAQRIRAKGGALVHNHPDNLEYEIDDLRRDGGSFSPEDFLVAAYYDIEEIFAISRNFKHYAFPNGGSWQKRMLEKVEVQLPDGTNKETFRFDADFNYYYNRTFNEMYQKIINKSYKSESVRDKDLRLIYTKAVNKTYEILSKLYDFAYFKI